MLLGSVIWFKTKNQGERQSKKLDEEKTGKEEDITTKKKQTKRKKNSDVSVNDKIEGRMG